MLIDCVIFSCFDKWHTFLLEEIENKRLSKSVFRSVNHYLCHIPYVIRNLGPMRSFSTRPLERTIGKFSKLIKSRKDSGVNAGNVIERIATRQYVRFAIDSEKKVNLITKKPYSSNTVIDGPPDSLESHELWSPILRDFNLISARNDYSSFLGVNITNRIILEALKGFYIRALPRPSYKSLDLIVEIAGRALIGSTLFSSVFSRHYQNQYGRGNHHIMFNSLVIE